MLHVFAHFRGPPKRLQAVDTGSPFGKQPKLKAADAEPNVEWLIKTWLNIEGFRIPVSSLLLIGDGIDCSSKT